MINWEKQIKLMTLDATRLHQNTIQNQHLHNICTPWPSRSRKRRKHGTWGILTTARPTSRETRLPSDASPTSRQVMNAFYRRIFPYKPFFKWLNQAEGEFDESL